MEATLAYTLYGSLTSPFVRRIRMLLGDIPYELVDWNIYETDDATKLNKINPVNQVPVLADGETIIWDSRQVFNYLNYKHKFCELTWDEENRLTAIEGAMNSAVALMLMKRSGMNTTEPYMYVNRQKERIDSVLEYLKPFVTGAGLTTFDFQSITLYSFLDWGQFRGIISLENRPELKKFIETHKNSPLVQKTEIPKV